MLAGFHNCCQPPRTDAGMHIYTHQKTQLVDFLCPNVNTLITSSLNPSLKIPLKRSVAPACLPALASSPSLLSALPRCNRSSCLQLDNSQAEHDDTKDCARNIKHDTLYHSRCQTLMECLLLHLHQTLFQKAAALTLNPFFQSLTANEQSHQNV